MESPIVIRTFLIFRPFDLADANCHNRVERAASLVSRTHRHKYAHTDAHTLCMCVHAHTYTRARGRTHARTRTHAHTHVHHTYVHADLSTYMHTEYAQRI